MRIQYLTTRHIREVADSIGARLIGSGIARMAPSDEESREVGPAVEETREPETPARKRKRKRTYGRRDMRAAD